MTKRNLTDRERDYLEAQKILIAKAPKQLIASSPALFANRVGVQSLITRYELYKLILEVPGDIIECGVYQGNSLTWLAHLSIILEPHAINRRLIGFDTFEGFISIDDHADPSDINNKHFSDTSYELISESLQLLDFLRPVNKVPRFELIKGDILETLPAYIEAHPWMTCAMLILDTDLYKPTKIALECVVSIMPKGGVIVFDEYNYQNFPGETQAIREVLSMNGLRVKKPFYESCTAYAVIE
jgi:hypothetical protein